NVVDASAASPITAFLDSENNIAQSFTIGYPGGPDNKPTSLTITGLGTGHEVSHVTNVTLWWDSNANDVLEPLTDTSIDTGNYAADNGTIVFDLSLLPDFTQGTTRRFFVTYDFNLAATHLNTFKCYVSAVAGAQLGATYTGLPAPSNLGAPGITMSAIMLMATLNGPGAANTVQNNSVGVTGDGELLADVTLTATNGLAWNMGGLTFASAGTADAATAYQSLGIYEDTGNGIWDGSSTDGAAAGTHNGGFTAGLVTFQLSNDLLSPGQSRRFFLVGKLAGTATTAQTLNARLEAITGTPPVGGVQLGFPTSESTALIINVAVLTVGNAPGAPAGQLHQAGSALAFLMAKFRLSASNDAVSVSGMTLTATGSGNWPNSMAGSNGVQVYLDNGDGAFNPPTDALLYEGAGNASIPATFSSNVNVPVRGHQDIWVRVNLLANAGVGLTSQQSYTLTVLNPSDVNTATQVLLGSPLPQGATLNVVDFFVTSIDPLSDLPAGGKTITLTGSGFLSPFQVTIGGVICPGTPTVTPTHVTGIQVPQHTGNATGLAIVVTSGGLPPLTLTDTFDYTTPSTGGASSDGGGGCTAGTGATLTLMPAMLALAALRRRRK
ncbi:MAG TPA: IPT/TIG domain-containing protein, partial [Polyangiaceae bacterium]|nr:IPT/TIG domain-containing protein [Polyangiaceae bacterium]